MDIYLDAFTKTLMQHMTLFYSMVCCSSVSGRNPQFWRVTSSKAARFPCQDHGVYTGSGKLQTWGQAHSIPDCHIQSTSPQINGFMKSCSQPEPQTQNRDGDRYHSWATFTSGLLQKESEGHSFHQILSGMNALVCAYFETMSEGSAQDSRRGNDYKTAENAQWLQFCISAFSE